ncbi:MAG: radical SAM family heme chaperone HemW [Anaerolineae bacterium]
MSETVGLYIHIPFCWRKCHYCDFVSFAGRWELWPAYLRVLLQEVRAMPPLKPRTLYVGGGTPTIWPAEYLASLVQAAREVGLPETAEVTVEANPGTVNLEKLVRLRRAGYNRLSLGVQSTFNANLHLLGRSHNYNQAKAAISWARGAGFANLNVDMIYGLPGQSLSGWLRDLERALALNSEHLSAYALSLEEGTPLARAVAAGVLPSPDGDLQADMYEATEDMLTAAGYEHYEISNWAKNDRSQESGNGISTPDSWLQIPIPFTCQHNLIYWHNEPYLGLGVAAHSFLEGKRFARIVDPIAYISAEPAARVAFSETIDKPLEMAETAILGLRLLTGLSRRRFCNRFGIDPLVLYRKPFMWAQGEGLLTINADSISLTRRGRLLSNEVFERLLPAGEGPVSSAYVLQ